MSAKYLVTMNAHKIYTCIRLNTIMKNGQKLCGFGNIFKCFQDLYMAYIYYLFIFLHPNQFNKLKLKNM